jgi:uncharacterized protein involved in response to NO
MPAQSETHFLDHPFLGRGFRPFFLVAALQTATAMLAWTGFYGGVAPPQSIYSDPVLWHAHEMIYGFVMAVVAGFLLTAVANWTAGAPVRQAHLLLLALLWFAGRLVINAGELPLAVVAAVDCAFIPALGLSLAVPLWKSRNVRNFIFLGLLAALLACNAAFYILEDRAPLHVALLIIIAMISLVAGRIIPAFTVAALRLKGLPVRQQDQPLLDRICLASMIALVLAATITGLATPVTGVMAGLAAGFNLLRLRHYHTPEALKVPMLWILHAGYAWMVLGLFLLMLSCFGYGTISAAIHALTAGCIGSMCIGMMCRVTLGHTGRHILARPLTVTAFVVMQAAALLRVAGPELLPEWYLHWIVASGLLWSACFAIYLAVYSPMLWRARPDGLPA